MACTILCFISFFHYFIRNELEKDSEEPLWLKFLEQLRQPLLMLLMGSAVVSALVGQLDDAISIFLAILIVASVAFVQEYRSEKSLESLNRLVPHYCHVRRSAHWLTLLATELVPGDIVRLATGDRVPADLRLVECTDLEVDESNLSGETTPSRKHTQLLTPAATTTPDTPTPPPVVERFNIAYMGTLVRAGHGIGVVVATGKNTEFGVIWTMMKDVQVQKTPLQLKMEHLGKQLSFISVLIF